MKFLKTYIAFLLLFVFSCLLVPSSLLHTVFADHHDTACDFKHGQGATRFEEPHTHCDIFATNTPLYDAPSLIVFEKPLRLLLSEYDAKVVISFCDFARNLLPARGPPLA